MDNLPSVQIIVLNWNGLSYLEACLSALSSLSYPNYDICFVDNNSTDGSIDFVRQSFPHIEILQNERNLGYAAGNNRVLRQLQADYAVIVNPDILVPKDWLTKLIFPIYKDPSIGIAGCKLHYPDGQTIQHAGGTISHPQAMPIHQGMFEQDAGQFDDMRDVDYVTGAVMLVKRSVLECIGFLDEGFFMYFEEADYCARARAAGYRVVYVPQATAVHDESAIAVKGSPSYLRRFHTGRWRFIVKHFDVEEIISATIKAEEEWLQEISPSERQAVKHGYRTIYLGLNEIFTARSRDGGTKISKAQQASLTECLLEIREFSITTPASKADIEHLHNKAQIHELSIQSQTPVIGAFIAQLRSLFAQIAAREQSKAFSSQQSDFNFQLVSELQEIQRRLNTLELELLSHDGKQAGIQQHQIEIKTELSHAYTLLESIEARISRIENRSRS